VIDQVSFLLQHTSSFNEVRGTPEARIVMSYLPSLIVYLINSLLLPYLIDVSLRFGNPNDLMSSQLHDIRSVPTMRSITAIRLV